MVGGTGFYLKALLFGLWDAPAAPPELKKMLQEKDNNKNKKRAEGKRRYLPKNLRLILRVNKLPALLPMPGLAQCQYIPELFFPKTLLLPGQSFPRINVRGCICR